MLLNTLVKTVKRDTHRGSQAVTTDQITTDIVANCNRAIREVVKLLPKRFWFKQSTVAMTVGVAGTPATYSLASDCQEPILFHYTSSGSVYRLKKIDSDAEWIDQIWNVAQAVDRPRFYRELGPNSSTGYKQIEVFPIPNGSYTLNYEYYRTKGSDLTTANLESEIPDLPDYLHDILEKGAVYYFLKSFDDPAARPDGSAERDYLRAQLQLENADERDIDSDNQMRWGMGQPNLLPPGFRLDNR